MGAAVIRKVVCDTSFLLCALDFFHNCRERSDRSQYGELKLRMQLFPVEYYKDVKDLLQVTLQVSYTEKNQEAATVPLTLNQRERLKEGLVWDISESKNTQIAGQVVLMQSEYSWTLC